jgi:hypothetical protein
MGRSGIGLRREDGGGDVGGNVEVEGRGGGRGEGGGVVEHAEIAAIITARSRVRTGGPGRLGSGG